MNKKYLLALIIVIIVAVGIFICTPHTPSAGLSSERLPLKEGDNTSLPISAYVKVPNGQEIGLRVADDNQERELGLSYFKSLPQDQGMLFVFDKPGIYPFWMKGMNFPLDIIWLKSEQGGGYRVVYVARNVSPSSYPNSINPKTEADAVLEMNSNLSTVYNLELEKNLWISFKK